MAIPGLESATRYQELIYRLLSEDAEFSVPGFIWESDRPEYSFLKRELLWCAQVITAGPVAAQFSYVQLLNPVGSTRIVVVTEFHAGTTAAGKVTQALTTTVRGASGGAFAGARDTRWNTPIAAAAAPNARDGAISITFGTAAGFGTDVQLGQDATGVNITRLNLPLVVLAPGTGVTISDALANEALTCFMAGYSRVARPEELIV